MKLERIQLSIDHFEKMIATVDSNLIVARLELSIKRDEKLKRAEFEFQKQREKYDLIEDDELRNLKMSRAEKTYQDRREDIEDDYKFYLQQKESSAKSSKSYFQSSLAFQKDKYETALKRQRQKLTDKENS